MIGADLARAQLPPKPQRRLDGVQSRYLKYGNSAPITLVQEPIKLTFMDSSEPSIKLRKKNFKMNEVAPLTQKSCLWPLTVEDQPVAH